MAYTRFASQIRTLDSEDARLLAIERAVLPSMDIIAAGYLADDKACSRMRSALLKIVLADIASTNTEVCQTGLVSPTRSRILNAVPMAASLLSRPSTQDKVVALLVLEHACPPVDIWEHLLLNSICRELGEHGSNEGARLMLEYLTHNMPRREALIEAVIPEVLALLKRSTPQTIVPCYAFLGSLADYYSEFMAATFAEAIQIAEEDMDLVETGSLSWKIIQGSVLLVTRLLANTNYCKLVTQQYIMRLLHVWEGITDGRWPRSFDSYHGILNPFLQINVLRLLASSMRSLPLDAVGRFQKVLWTYLRTPRINVTEGASNQPDEHYSNIRAGMLIECSMIVISNECLHTQELLHDVLPRVFHLVSTPGGKRSLMIGFSKLAATLHAPLNISAYIPKFKSTVTPIISDLTSINDSSIALEGCRLAVALFTSDAINPQICVLSICQCMDRFSFPYEIKAALLGELTTLLRTRLPSNPEGVTPLLFFTCNKMGLLPLEWLRETAKVCHEAYTCKREGIPATILMLGRVIRQYHCYNVLMLVMLIIGQMLRSSIDVFLTSTAAYLNIDSLRNTFQQIAVTYTDTHTGRQACIRDGYAALCLIVLALNTVTIEPIESLAESLGNHISATQRSNLKQLIMDSRSAEEVLSGLRTDILKGVDRGFTSPVIN